MADSVVRTADVALPDPIPELLLVVGEYFHAHGRWPNADELQRSLARESSALDVYAELGRIGTRLAHMWSGDTQAIALTVRGLAMCPACGPDLGDLLRAIEVFRDAYLSEEPDPEITEADLRERLLLDDLRAIKVVALLDQFGYVTAGGGTRDDGGRWWRVGGGVHRFRGTASVDDLLAVLDEIERPRPSPNLSALVGAGAPVPSVASGPSSDASLLHIDDLHGDVSEVARDLVGTATPGVAIREASRVLTRVLRSKTGLTSDGTRLVDEAFKRLEVADLSTRTGASIQEGVRQLSLGVMRSLRNLHVHDDVALSDAEVMEALALISYVVRRLDAAAVVNPSSSAI